MSITDILFELLDSYSNLFIFHIAAIINTHVLSFRETVDEVLNVHPSFLECHGCKESIKDRYFLRAMDKYWHEDCLACDLCQCRLGEVDCYVYTKLGRKLCKRDYLR